MMSALRRSRIPWPTAVGALVLVTVVAHTGTAPVVAGLGSLDAPTLVACVALAAVTTVACAWRWRLVAAGLGVPIGMPAAVAACYRAQLLNTVLPGGVLGDVHRGVLHGRAAGATGPALRAVAWERSAGQAVHLVLAAVVLLVLPSPLGDAVPVAAGTGVLLLLATWLVVRRRPVGGFSWTARVLTAPREDVRCGLLVRRAWPGVLVASTVATAGHTATFVVAARAVGVDTPVVEMLPVTVLVLVAAGLPLNLAGWGPREGMAAWSFAAAGIGAEQGVAVAVAYGTLVLLANLPGAVVLVLGSRPALEPRRVGARPVAPVAGRVSGGAGSA
jgi:uncharacterized membrane protein YbhN (UPF0104 family)